ncbi:MAG: IS1634 family transposase [Rikenellaceae bacterium]
MRLQIKNTGKSQLFYIVKSYRDSNGKSTSRIFEKLGTYEEVKVRSGSQDPVEWAKLYANELTENENSESKVILELTPTLNIKKHAQHTYNGGYLFLQQIYYDLGLDKICKAITKKHKFGYNLNSVLSRLVYGRILHPKSKLATMELSKRFIEQPDFDLQHTYRSLSVLALESDFIQSELFKNSQKIIKRNTGVIFYDCTNFFFEIEEAEGIKQYGVSKEHRPNPIVQMGMFMDYDGLPLAYCINPGNTNEQVTMKPLEEKLDKQFELSQFVVCTDGGLSSIENRKYNSQGNRSFITTQSLKKFKGHLKEWSLSPEGWNVNKRDSNGNRDNKIYNINELDTETDYSEVTFYKDRWINEDGLEQHLIVTYSIKYRNYMRSIRDKHIDKATKAIEGGTAKLNKKRSTDHKRFIIEEKITSEGEIAKKSIYSLDDKRIEDEAMYDGFYAVCTNLKDKPLDIIRVNHQRWEIEAAFRIMKSELKARPVYLHRDDRIKAHFITCFISLMVLKTLEKKIGGCFSSAEIISELSTMNFYNLDGEGYIPTYTRTDLTDLLHEKFKFRTDYQIIKNQTMKKIISSTKK